MFAPLTVVEAPPDVPATAIATLAANDLTTVVLTMPPFKATPAVIASEILRALGKRTDVNGKARHGINDKVLVPVWLSAHRVQTLIVAAPQEVNYDNLTDLIDLCVTSPTSVVIACDYGTAYRVRQAIQGHLPLSQDWPSTLPEHEALPTPNGPHWTPGAPIRLPHCEFLNFYATAERTLPAHIFTDLSLRYVDALNRTLEWLLAVIDANHGTVPERQVTQAMRTLLEDQQTLDQVTTVVHAAEAAFFRHGWLLKVDRRELRSGLIRFPSPEVTTDTWTRIRAYREPARAATVALYLCGLTISELETVTIASVANWDADTSTPISGRLIPLDAAPYLRAQLLNRATVGSAAEDPFLLSTTARRIGLDVLQASGDLDLFLSDGSLDKSTRHGDRRVTTKAFSVEQLS